MPDWENVNAVKHMVEDGKSYRETAFALGMTVGQVAGIMNRYRDTDIIDLSNVHNMSKEDRNEYFDKIIEKLKGMQQ
jgi:DNA invertase Pin-like site-specific DNA recombinase